MLVNLFQPVRNIVKGLLVSAVIHKNDAHGSLIVGLGNSTESFLSGGIPNLQFDSLIVDIYFLNLEVDT